MENFIELEQTLVESAMAHMFRPLRETEWYFGEQNLYNRRFLNFLSSGRAYEDQVVRHIRTVLSEDRDKRARAHQVLDESRDNRFYHRLMKEIRNFAQHRDFPIHSATWHSHVVAESTQRTYAHTAVPFIDVNRFLRDRKLDPSLRNRLEKMGDKIPVPPLVREYLKALWCIHRDIRTLMENEVSASLEFLSSILEEARLYDGSMAVIAVKWQAKQQQAPVARVEIFPDLITYYNYLIEKNHLIGNPTAGFVASAAFASSEGP